MADTAVDLGFLETAGNNGFENMGAGEISTPLLLIAQPLSKVVSDDKVKAGHFYNSITGEDYGNQLKVIVCHFDKMWYEWKPDQGGLAGRYPVGSVEVEGDKWTGMINKETGNKIEEKYVYLVYLPEHPEAGLLVFASTGGNMKYLKGWNTQMRYLRTPSGRQAPLFAAIWSMTVNKDTNKNNQPFYSCNEAGKSSIRFDSWVSKEIYDTAILPARETASQAIAIADMREQDAEADTNGNAVETSDF
jgi:hypothetical protein